MKSCPTPTPLDIGEKYLKTISFCCWWRHSSSCERNAELCLISYTLCFFLYGSRQSWLFLAGVGTLAATPMLTSSTLLLLLLLTASDQQLISFAQQLLLTASDQQLAYVALLRKVLLFQLSLFKEKL
jgi:hypothetical protein